MSDGVGSATSAREKVCAVETYLVVRWAAAHRARPTHRAARSLETAHGCLELAQLVDEYGLSERQFRRDRRAAGHVAQALARVLRFEYALRLEDSRPWMSWVQVSQESGHVRSTTSRSPTAKR